MRAGLADPRTVVDLARAGRYSPFHFHRIFREVTMVTPARYLAALRIAEARRLLVRSTLTVTEISWRVGYQSLGTFTTQFGRLVGLAPQQFRQLMRVLRDEPVGALFAALPATGHHEAGPDRAGGRAASPGRCLLTLSRAAPWPALIVAGLCPAGSLSEQSGRWVASAGCTQVRLPVEPGPGDFSAFLVAVRTDARLIDALLDQVAGSHLIGASRVRLPPGPDHVAVPMTLRGPLPTDPPILALAPLRWLAHDPARYWPAGGRTARARPALGHHRRLSQPAGSMADLINGPAPPVAAVGPGPATLNG